MGLNSKDLFKQGLKADPGEPDKILGPLVEKKIVKVGKGDKAIMVESFDVGLGVVPQDGKQLVEAILESGGDPEKLSKAFGKPLFSVVFSGKNVNDEEDQLSIIFKEQTHAMDLMLKLMRTFLPAEILHGIGVVMADYFKEKGIGEEDG